MSNVNAQHDDNYLPTALFAQQGATQFVAPGQIDQTTGRILVDLNGSATQPGALFLEIPTGTVNGVNTVFTVQQNPLFEEVSGQVMVSQAQDGTNYGYVLSGTGPYTLTFSSAPQTGQTPHSFYNGANGSSGLSSFFQTDTFTSTLNQTVFTSTIVPTFVFSFTVNDQPMTLNVDYTQSGHTFTLVSGIPAGLPVTIVYLHQ